MGGAINDGNVTPYAEFNFYSDPHAVSIVFNSNFKNIIMLGLDVTHKLPLTKKLEDRLLTDDNELSNFIYNISRIGADFDRNEGHDGLIINDPKTISYLLDSSIISLKDAKITVEITGEKIGKTNVTFVQKSNCKVGIDVDTDKFYKLLYKRVLNIDL